MGFVPTECLRFLVDLSFFMIRCFTDRGALDRVTHNETTWQHLVSATVTNMSAIAMFRRVLRKEIPDLIALNAPVSCQIQSSRNAGMWRPKITPKPGIKGQSWRRIVHFKDEYTVEPLEVTNLAGRDPVTGKCCSSLR